MCFCMMLIRVVLSARKRGERACLSVCCRNCSGYLMRHSIRRISVFNNPIASSIRCRQGIFFLLKPYTVRFETVQAKGEITQQYAIILFVDTEIGYMRSQFFDSFCKFRCRNFALRAFRQQTEKSLLKNKFHIII